MAKQACCSEAVAYFARAAIYDKKDYNNRSYNA